MRARRKDTQRKTSLYVNLCFRYKNSRDEIRRCRKSLRNGDFSSSRQKSFRLRLQALAQRVLRNPTHCRKIRSAFARPWKRTRPPRTSRRRVRWGFRILRKGLYAPFFWQQWFWRLSYSISEKQYNLQLTACQQIKMRPNANIIAKKIAISK